MKILTAFIFLFLLFCRTYGTETDSLSSKEKKFIILPYAYYTTDTGFAFALFSQYRFDREDKIFANAVYTQNNQLMFQAITDKKFRNVILHNTIKIKDYFSEVYGTGNRTQKKDNIPYRYFQIDNKIETGKYLSGHSSVFAIINNFVHKPEIEGKYTDELSLGYSEKETHYLNGIGTSYRFSNVTKEFFRDGMYFKSSYILYPEGTGNVEQFSVFEIEAAHFKSIRESAFNTLLSSRFTAGDPHPEKLSYIGGSSVMRGYPEKRFLDRNMISIQTQYDIRVYKKISACLFVSAGDVFNELDDLSIKNTKFGYGTGILYDFKGINMRFDVATSPEKEIQIIIIGFRAF